MITDAVKYFIKVFTLLFTIFIGMIAIYALLQKPVLEAISWFGLFLICAWVYDLVDWAWK